MKKNKLNKFSIIIPTYNRGKYLLKMLTRLSHLDYPKKYYEIIIVDNNSSDDTKQIINTFLRKHKHVKINYVFEKLQGRTFASNKGIRKSKYNKIIFLDDDIIFPRNLLVIYNQLYNTYSDSVVIGGKIIAKCNYVKNTSIFYDKEIDYWIVGQIDYGNTERYLEFPEGLFSGNFSFNKENLQDYFFNSNLGVKQGKYYLYGEDYELCLRLHLSTQKVLYSPKLTVTNIIESERFDFRNILKRYLQAGMEKKVIDRVLMNKYPHYKKFNSLHLNLYSNVKHMVQVNLFFGFCKLLANLIKNVFFIYGYYSYK